MIILALIYPSQNFYSKNFPFFFLPLHHSPFKVIGAVYLRTFTLSFPIFVFTCKYRYRIFLLVNFDDANITTFFSIHKISCYYNILLLFDQASFPVIIIIHPFSFVAEKSLKSLIIQFHSSYHRRINLCMFHCILTSLKFLLHDIDLI